MCVFFYKKSRNGCKSIFDECDKKIIKHFAKKSFRVLKNAKNITFKHPKPFFGKMFYYFLITFFKNAFVTIS